MDWTWNKNLSALEAAIREQTDAAMNRNYQLNPEHIAQWATRHKRSLVVDALTDLVCQAMEQRNADEQLAQIPNFQVALRQAREILAQWVDKGDAVDLAVRKKIASLKRGVVEGSAEWSILYRRYREDELRKKGPQR